MLALDSTGSAAPATRQTLPWDDRVQLATGMRLAAVDAGDPDGAPIVFLHGYSDSSQSWSLLPPRLDGGRLICPDLRGHGRSDKPRRGYDLQTLTDDVVGFMDAVGAPRATVVGHSLGSMIAQRLAALHPERVDRLVLIGSTGLPPVKLGDWMRTSVAALTAAPDRDSTFLKELQFNPLPVDPTFLATALEESLLLPLHVWRGVIEGLTDHALAPYARAIRAPTLIVWGDQDPMFGPEHQQALRDCIPQARFETLKGAGHNPHWEQPTRVAALLADFIPGLRTVRHYMDS